MRQNFSARGLLIERAKMLFVEYQFEDTTFYALPGGTVEVGEDLRSCLRREFEEEASMQVEVGELVLLNEFIKPNPKVIAPQWKDGIHQIEAIFEVKRVVLPSSKMATNVFDPGMQGVRWLAADELAKVTYYPEVSVDWLFSGDKVAGKYLSKRYD